VCEGEQEVVRRVGRRQQRASRIAAAIRGPNRCTWPEAVTSRAEGGAARGAERFQRPGQEAAGRRPQPGVARHAVTAAAAPIGPPTDMVLAEVRRRAHLRAALTRVQAHPGAPGVDGRTVDAGGPPEGLARHPTAVAPAP
jgi:hypothetical protein